MDVEAEMVATSQETERKKTVRKTSINLSLTVIRMTLKRKEECYCEHIS